MIDDAPPGPHAFPVGYDFLKHVTTIALIGIGGVLGLLSGDGPRLPASVIVVVVALLAGGGFAAVTGMATLARVEDLPPPDPDAFRARMRRLRLLASSATMCGLGVFLGAFVQVLIEFKG